MTCQRRSGYLWQRHRGVPGLATDGTRGQVRRFPCSFGLTGGQSEREIRQHSFNIPSCVDRLPHSIQQIVIAFRPPQPLQPLLAAPVPEISRTTTTHPFAVKLGPTHWPASTRLRLAASERALGANFQRSYSLSAFTLVGYSVTRKTMRADEPAWLGWPSLRGRPHRPQGANDSSVMLCVSAEDNPDEIRHRLSMQREVAGIRRYVSRYNGAQRCSLEDMRIDDLTRGSRMPAMSLSFGGGGDQRFRAAGAAGVAGVGRLQYRQLAVVDVGIVAEVARVEVGPGP